jgi:hypothetical protein
MVHFLYKASMSKQTVIDGPVEFIITEFDCRSYVTSTKEFKLN